MDHYCIPADDRGKLQDIRLLKLAIIHGNVGGAEVREAFQPLDLTNGRSRRLVVDRDAGSRSFLLGPFGVDRRCESRAGSDYLRLSVPRPQARGGHRERYQTHSNYEHGYGPVVGMVPMEPRSSFDAVRGAVEDVVVAQHARFHSLPVLAHKGAGGETAAIDSGGVDIRGGEA